MSRKSEKYSNSNYPFPDRSGERPDAVAVLEGFDKAAQANLTVGRRAGSRAGRAGRAIGTCQSGPQKGMGRSY